MEHFFVFVLGSLPTQCILISGWLYCVIHATEEFTDQLLRLQQLTPRCLSVRAVNINARLPRCRSLGDRVFPRSSNSRLVITDDPTSTTDAFRDVLASEVLFTVAHAGKSETYIGNETCADTIGTVPVPWAGHFQC